MKTYNCPSCNATVKPTGNINRCEYCGTWLNATGLILNDKQAYYYIPGGVMEPGDPDQYSIWKILHRDLVEENPDFNSYPWLLVIAFIFFLLPWLISLIQ